MQTTMQSLFVALFFLSLVPQALSQGTSTTVLRGVDIIEDELGMKFMDLELQCGEELVGLIVRETEAAIGVAAAVSRSPIQCSLAPHIKSVSLNVLNSQSKQIVALPSDEGEYRMSLQEVDVTHEKTEGLQISWDNTCRQFLGALLQPLALGEVSVAAAFRPSSLGSKNLSKCEMGRKKASFKSIRAGVVQFNSMRKQGKVEDLYTTRVISPIKVERLVDGQLQVTWLKSCNVVPLGLLFGGAQGTQIGMMTAYLPNAVCKDKGRIEAYVSPRGLNVASDKTFVPMDSASTRNINKTAFDLNFESPAKSVVRPNAQSVLVYKRSSCRQTFGVVLGRDSIGNASIANLQGDTLRSDCIAATGKLVQVAFPVITAPDMATPKIYPLRIKGTMAR